MSADKHQAAIYVQAPLERVWQACTVPADLSEWYSAPCLRFGTQPGDALAFGTQDKVVIQGRVLECEPLSRLRHTFAFQGMGFEEESLVAMSLQAQGPVTLLQVWHDCRGAEETARLIGPLGWPKLFARLKTWLETGTPMPWPQEVPKADG